MSPAGCGRPTSRATINAVTSLADRLASLPAPIAELMPPVVELAERGPSDKLDRALAKVMRAAGFSPNKERFVERPILLASALTAEQRALVELLDELPPLSFAGWPVYTTPWLRKRWLGREPGGVLFAEVTVKFDDAKVRWPLIHAVRHLLILGDDGRALSLVDALALAERTEAFVGLVLADRDLEMQAFAEAISETARALLGAGETPWAAALLDWTLTQQPSDLPESAALLLFAALVGREGTSESLARLRRAHSREFGQFEQLGQREAGVAQAVADYVQSGPPGEAPASKPAKRKPAKKKSAKP